MPGDDLSKLEELIKKNIVLTEELQKQMKTVRHYILWQRALSIFYLIIIVGPIILGIIYLPPLLQNAIAPYEELLGGSQNGNLDINKVLNGLKH